MKLFKLFIIYLLFVWFSSAYMPFQDSIYNWFKFTCNNWVVHKLEWCYTSNEFDIMAKEYCKNIWVSPDNYWLYYNISTLWDTNSCTDNSKSDLVIDAYSWNKNNYYEFIVRNMWRKDAKSVIVIVKTDDMIGGSSGWKRMLIWDLSAWTSKKFSVELFRPSNTNFLDPFFVYIELDPDNTIDESNEENQYTYKVVEYEIIETEFISLYNDIVNNLSLPTWPDSWWAKLYALFTKYQNYNPFVRELYDIYLTKLDKIITFWPQASNQSLWAENNGNNTNNLSQVQTFNWESTSKNLKQSSYTLSKRNKYQIDTVLNLFISKLESLYKDNKPQFLSDLQTLVNRVDDKILSTDNKKLLVILNYIKDKLNSKINELK